MHTAKSDFESRRDNENAQRNQRERRLEVLLADNGDTNHVFLSSKSMSGSSATRMESKRTYSRHFGSVQVYTKLPARTGHTCCRTDNASKLVTRSVFEQQQNLGRT